MDLPLPFIRAADATRVLSKRRSSRGSPIVIKPDMSPNERKCEWLKMVSLAVRCPSWWHQNPWFSFTRQKQALWSSLEMWFRPLSKVMLWCQWQCCWKISSPIVPRLKRLWPCNVNCCSASSQDQLSTPPPSSPQSSSTTPVSRQWLHNCIKLFNLNSCSLVSKLSNIQSFVYSSLYDIICITETWFSAMSMIMRFFDHQSSQIQLWVPPCYELHTYSKTKVFCASDSDQLFQSSILTLRFHYIC